MCVLHSLTAPASVRYWDQRRCESRAHSFMYWLHSVFLVPASVRRRRRRGTERGTFSAEYQSSPVGVVAGRRRIPTDRGRGKPFYTHTRMPAATSSARLDRRDACCSRAPPRPRHSRHAMHFARCRRCGRCRSRKTHALLPIPQLAPREPASDALCPSLTAALSSACQVPYPILRPTTSTT